MHQLFRWDVVNDIDKEYFFLQDLSPAVDHGDDDWTKTKEKS